MPESTEENKPVIIGTIKGRIGTKENSQGRFFPVDPDGKPIISIEDPPGSVYDEKGKPQPLHSSTGIIVDIEA